ncbi:DNA adenine methylase [uncultured Mailhella sp.]|uniref:DNA adenine methylase n=1 Tax=uncultured Mailhella sp. TaxID=1981031 RepID=UPI0025DD91FF|nr:DNA adenine methylase [uncultured Mailhella sp.]
MSKNMLVAPILKWVGGKRQLLNDILPLIQSKGTYIEPFLGGGAVLFAHQPKKAIVNDYNSELMNVYQVVKSYPEQLIQILQVHYANNSEEYYYSIRELDRDEQYKNISLIEKAARIIYLNKTCYNGLYRVNSSGYFNSPYGKYKNPNIVNAPVIRAMSKYFNDNDITLLQGDYKEVLKKVKKGSFVYLDPPYMPLSRSANFTGYTENGFGYKEQEELKQECDRLREKGIRFVQSNSDCLEIRELYKDYTIKTVQAKRVINSNSAKRGEINEVLIYA